MGYAPLKAADLNAKFRKSVRFIELLDINECTVWQARWILNRLDGLNEVQ